MPGGEDGDSIGIAKQLRIKCHENRPPDTMIEMSMNDKEREMFEPCKVRCISDDESIFFKKGEIYDAFIPKCNGGKGFFAFYFTAEEMDEEGLYALPASHFEVIG